MFENVSMLDLVARLLFGGMFVFVGLRNIGNAKMLAGMMTARGVRLAEPVLWAGISLQILAGLMVIADFHLVYAASALVLFMVATLPMFHNFWNYQGMERTSRFNSFVGAFLLASNLLLLISRSQ
ncbi:DoxX family protein [Aminobacter sp. HY435]|uniref:DoxX family protein n=1 Tax=Aminobacter sp. HY435 TaxID=2970917 RepID=UPI0022B9ABA8|nr:DoxX family protein [Aminobacter sp. HY435]